MRDASVGHQCAECVSAGAKTVRQPKARSGGPWGSTMPVVTYVLIAINVVAFVIQMASPRLEAEFVMWSPAVANGELYRLLTSAFLHSGITHILFNMFALFVVGPPLEIWLGRARFIALYLLSAIGGSVLIYLFSPLDVPTLGASGAVFGLFAATFVVGRKVNVDIRWVVIMIVDQPGHHVHRAVDQLAGSPGWARDRWPGGLRLRLRAREGATAGAGGRDGRDPRAVRRADLVAHELSAWRWSNAVAASRLASARRSTASSEPRRSIAPITLSSSSLRNTSLMGSWS